VHFHEQPVDTDGDSGPGKRTGVLALTTRRRSLSAGLLNAVRDVEDHRCTCVTQLRQRAVVDDERVVPE